MQRGITLVELLVVVALLGFLALLGTAQLTHIVQKNQLQSAARDVTSFLQSVPELVSKQQAPLFVRFFPPAGSAPARLEISRDVTGTSVLRQLALRPEIRFSLTSESNVDINWPKAAATQVYTLRCDTFGRATNADSGGQLGGEARLMLTHVNMLKGTLKPKYGFEVGVAPVWNVVSRKVYSWNP
ncbi:MAG: prepilin-type N-terminal cleavage/methylation domain-containing protein [Thermoanaerobaculaceae bacterium]